MATESQGSPEALMQQLHDEHAAALWGYSLRLTGQDRARAEDVVQETLLRAWRNFPALDESHGSVRDWLFRVAKNIVIDEWRTKRSQSEIAVADVPEGAGEPDVRTLQGWRREVVGTELLELLDGRRALRVGPGHRLQIEAD